MEFIEDLWIIIKEFVFHRHLWYINSPFLKVIRSIPIVSVTPSHFYPVNFIQSYSRYSDKFIKSYNVLNWNNYNIPLITYYEIKKDENIQETLFSMR